MVNIKSSNEDNLLNSTEPLASKPSKDVETNDVGNKRENPGLDVLRFKNNFLEVGFIYYIPYSQIRFIFHFFADGRRTTSAKGTD